jgi:hypothetical protein
MSKRFFRVLCLREQERLSLKWTLLSSHSASVRRSEEEEGLAVSEIPTSAKGGLLQLKLGDSGSRDLWNQVRLGPFLEFYKVY